MILRKAVWLLLFVAFVSVVPASTTYAKPKDAWQTFYDQGQQSFSDGDYSSAERNFLNALDLLKEPLTNSVRIPLTLSKLTRTLLLENYSGTAEAYYTKLRKTLNARDGDSKVQCEFAIALDDLADTYEDKGNAQRDPNYLEHALELRKSVCGKAHPKYAETLRYLANWYSGSAQYSKAVPILRELISMDPYPLSSLRHANDFDSQAFLAFHNRYYLGLNYFGANKYSEAERTFNDLLANMSKSQLKGEWARSIYSALSAMYLEAGRYEEAKKCCKLAISLNRFSALKEKPSESAKVAVYKTNDPEWKTIGDLMFDYYLMGSILEHLNRPKESESYLRQSIKQMQETFGEYGTELTLPYRELATFLARHNHSLEASAFTRKNQRIHERMDHTHPTLTDDQIDRRYYILRVLPGNSHPTIH